MPDDSSLVTHIEACTRTQQATNLHMRAVQSNWSQPGPPNGPAALDALIAECQQTIAVAQELKGRR